MNHLPYCLLTFLLAAASPKQGLEPPVERAEATEGRVRLELLVQRVQQSREDPALDAQVLGTEALELLEVFPDPELELDVRLGLSWGASRRGEMEIGFQQARLARMLAATSKDAAGVASADYHLAVAHWYSAEPEEALAAAEHALEAQRKLQDDEAIATTLTLIGSVHRSRSHYDASIACHLEALQVAQRNNDSLAIARSRNNIGLVYWRLGEQDRAREYLDLVVATYREQEKEAKLATALSNLGLILIELDEPNRAFTIFAEALNLNSVTDRTRAKLLSNIAFALEETGRLEAALESHHDALRLREDLEDQWGVSRTTGCIAFIHLEQGQYDVALSYYARAATAAELAGAREELGVILQGMAEAHEGLGEHEAALAALQRHVEIVQDLDRAETSRRVSELESKALLEAQDLIVGQERLARNTAVAGAVTLLLLAALGWNFFILKRRAHRKLESLHGRLTKHATELEQARGQIRDLEGLLPICSYCKSIRDELGDWKQLESYLHDHAGARLTHGICPECSTRALAAALEN